MKLKIISDFSLKKLLYNKKFTIPFSIGMAFVFWLIIMISQNPVREQTFSDIPVNITLDNTVAGESGMGIVTDLSQQKFNVTISGPSYIVSSLKTEDFSIYASAAEVNEPGEYSLELVGMRNGTKSGYTIVGISPATVNVSFDYIDKKEFTVTPKLIGVGVTEGLVVGTPVVSGTDSNTVTVTGPRTVVSTIETVVAYSEVNKTLSTSQSFDAVIQLFDENGNEIDQTGLTLSAATIKVSQPISKKATVRVKAAFSNLPSGMKDTVIPYTVNHSTVTIIGTPDVIDKLTEITLSAIDFFSVSTSSNSFDVSAALPDGVKILDNIEYFTVAIDTSAYTEKTLTVSSLKYKGLSSGLSAKSGGSIRNVKICGPADVIRKLTAKDLYAVIDLTDKSAGEHTVDAVIKSDNYTNIWQVGTYSTTVTIN